MTARGFSPQRLPGMLLNLRFLTDRWCGAAGRADRGTGSGKSEVSRRLADHGAVIIDADVAAREVIAPGTPELAQVAEAFGAGVPGPDGAVDRERLGAIVFRDPALRARLNAIVHPTGRRVDARGRAQGGGLGPERPDCRA